MCQSQSNRPSLRPGLVLSAYIDPPPYIASIAAFFSAFFSGVSASASLSATATVGTWAGLGLGVVASEPDVAFKV